jgi:hypothetical protein
MQQRVLYPMDSDVSEESLATVFSVNICTGATPPDDRNLDSSCVVTLCVERTGEVGAVRIVQFSSQMGGLFVILRELFCNFSSNMEYILSWQ